MYMGNVWVLGYSRIDFPSFQLCALAPFWLLISHRHFATGLGFAENRSRRTRFHKLQGFIRLRYLNKYCCCFLVQMRLVMQYVYSREEYEGRLNNIPTI
ncbi:hypothetical protein ABKV19_001727 [Rosa sericea]